MAANNYNLVCTDGQHMQGYVFPTMEIGTEWMEGVSSIKREIAEINHGREAVGHVDVDDAEDYTPWLVNVNAFVGRWGSDHVPADVVRAVHEIQDALGVTRTDFEMRHGQAGQAE